MTMAVMISSGASDGAAIAGDELRQRQAARRRAARRVRPRRRGSAAAARRRRRARRCRDCRAIVPRFWICTAPISRAAAFSASKAGGRSAPSRSRSRSSPRRCGRRRRRARTAQRIRSKHRRKPPCSGRSPAPGKMSVAPGDDAGAPRLAIRVLHRDRRGERTRDRLAGRSLYANDRAEPPRCQGQVRSVCRSGSPGNATPLCGASFASGYCETRPSVARRDRGVGLAKCGPTLAMHFRVQFLVPALIRCPERQWANRACPRH